MRKSDLEVQVGAMGIIDSLRHQEQAVQEHLDLSKRKRYIAERIAEYYKANGKEVNDDIINTGINEYFKGRLSFQERKLSRIKRLFFDAYVTRSKWWGSFRNISIVIILLVTGLSAGNYIYQNSRTNSLNDLDTIHAQIMELKLSGAPLADINATYETVRTAGTLWDINSAVKELNHFHTFVITPLSIELAKDDRGKRAYERTYNRSGDKKWYLIVSAKTSGGRSIPMSIKSSETGATKKVELFGIEVTHDTYRSLGREMKATGMLKDPVFGQKRANALEVEYDDNILSSRITEW